MVERSAKVVDDLPKHERPVRGRRFSLDRVADIHDLVRRSIVTLSFEEIRLTVLEGFRFPVESMGLLYAPVELPLGAAHRRHGRTIPLRRTMPIPRRRSPVKIAKWTASASINGSGPRGSRRRGVPRRSSSSPAT